MSDRTPLGPRGEDGLYMRAYSAAELIGLAQTLRQMPAPRGDQPREVILSMPHAASKPEVLGTMAWYPRTLEWLFCPSPTELQADDVMPYPFRPDQVAPSTARDGRS